MIKLRQSACKYIACFNKDYEFIDTLDNLAKAKEDVKKLMFFNNQYEGYDSINNVLDDYDKQKTFAYKDLEILEAEILRDFNFSKAGYGDEAETIAENLLNIGLFKRFDKKGKIIPTKVKATNIELTGAFFKNEIDIILEDDTIIEVKSSYDISKAWERALETRDKIEENEIDNAISFICLKTNFVIEAREYNDLEDFKEHITEIALTEWANISDDIAVNEDFYAKLYLLWGEEEFKNFLEDEEDLKAYEKAEVLKDAIESSEKIKEELYNSYIHNNIWTSFEF